MQSSENLAKYSETLAQAAVDAGNWVKRNPDLVRSDREWLPRELRRAERNLRNCARSAARPTSVGVFGPSQAGKSYLVTSLAGNEDGALIAVFNDRELDVLEEINPKNDGESTGLVTRFTMRKPEKLPDGYPVKTRLLTETDLVRILANTWFSDIKHNKAPVTDIAKELEALKNRQGNSDQGLKLDELEALQDYMQANFREKTGHLEREFWPTALELGQSLNLEGRIGLYSLIWDKNPEFTGLLRSLLLSLEKIGFAEELYCKLDALLPRNSSILNVSTLKKLGQEPELIDVYTATGLKTQLPKAVITALIAELVVVMRDVPKWGGDYFQETDLLDFPGYRSRLKITDIDAALEEDPGQLYMLFLRGKVAYLFQRYCDDIELNNMLLCVGPSNQEVQDLPEVIKNWIASTHGENPQDRLNKRTSLFFILTQADRIYDRDEGSPPVKESWTNRFNASLLNFFGEIGWVANWTPGKPFNNLFLLRNPAILRDSLFGYEQLDTGKVDAEGRPKLKNRETTILPEKRAFVEEVRQGLLSNSVAAKYLKDAASDWDSFMGLNDGGIGYISANLGPVCAPEIKYDQLRQRIDAIRRSISENLAKFYKSDDREELRAQKEESYDRITDYLVQLLSDNSLGSLIDCFSVSDSDVYDMRREAERRYRDRKKSQNAAALDEPAKSAGKKKKAWQVFDKLISKSGDNGAAGVEDEADFYASYIEDKWVQKLHQLADDEKIKTHFHIPSAIINEIASEMATGAMRCKLKEELAEKFRQISRYSNVYIESINHKQAIFAARLINNYVNWLGLNPDIESDKPIVVYDFEGEGREIFKRHSPIDGVPNLPEEADNNDIIWLTDWMGAMLEMMRLNVDFDGETTINIAENNALGAILKALRKEPGVEA